MPLRYKTPLIAGGTFVALTALLYTGARLGLLGGFAVPAAGLAAGLAVPTLLVDRPNRARLARLTAALAGIGAEGDLSARVPVEGDGELAGLARALNDMLASLEASQEEDRRVRAELVGRLDQAGRAEEALARSREYYLTVLDELPTPIRRLNLEGDCDYCNRQWLAFTGRTLPQEAGAGWLEGVHADDRTRVREAVASALAARRPCELEYRLRRHDGQYRWVIDAGRPLHDVDGAWAGCLSCCYDISDHRRLEEQFRHAQKMEALGRLAGGIAHDFNNLLTAINGYAGFARDALPPANPARDDLAQVLNAAGRAGNLTRQLLAFSRRETSAPRYVDLNDLVLNLGRMLRRLISEEIELEVIPTPDLGLVRVDPGQVEQVLVNLVVNAGDAMPQGGRLTIETASLTLDGEYARRHLGVDAGEYAMLAVSDTGCGMPDEVKAHIFEPFFTTKEAGRGTGLGLATCYALVKQNGGHIGFYSEPGQGTTFKLYFPRVFPGAESAPDSLPAEEAPCPAGASQTILLVEDDAAVRSFAARALREAGYTVLEAAGGPEALTLAAERNGNPIHLLIADVVMPHMGGEELARQLRAGHPDLRALFISGYTAHALAHNGALDADAAFLQKPFAVAALVRKVREVLAGT